VAVTAPADPAGRRTVLPGQTPDGKYVLAVLLKRTYRVVPFGPCERAPADRPLYGGDRHYADPMNTTVRFEADFVPYKLTTDVVLNGTAFAPGGRPAREFVAALEVGKARKQVRVIGDRMCRHRAGADPAFGDPQPFTQMPLRYERAYGGVDVYTDPRVQFPYPRNHLGKGFAVGNTKAVVDGLALPNLEDPADLLTPDRVCCGRIENWPKQPIPAGFGWYSKYWHPRAGWLGILPADRPVEQMMRKAYAQLLPEPARKLYEENPLPTVDFRFFNGASPGLALPYLAGDEAVRLTNLTPDGSLLFVLPGDKPAITLDLGDGPQAEPVVLHTVQIRADEGEVDLVWRAAFPYPGPEWLPQMKKADVAIHG
jgi:hypothetical protein